MNDWLTYLQGMPDWSKTDTSYWYQFLELVPATGIPSKFLNCSYFVIYSKHYSIL